MLSIEGRIRDLALAEVFQLLARGRKTGTLRCEAPLLSREASIGFAQGAIVDAEVAPVGLLHRDRGEAAPGGREIEEAALDVLCWKDGTFRFLPGELPSLRTRFAVEPLLIEAAQRAIVWDRIEALVPHARVVPAFEDLEPGQLPELRLSPLQWEVLAQVDGERDLVALATVLQREFTEVAEQVHDLIAIGLLTVREAPVAPRRNPTPPTNAALPPVDDLWVPDRYSGGVIRMPGDVDHAVDAIFDPVQVGVLTPEGLPALDLPAEALAGAFLAPRPIVGSTPDVGAESVTAGARATVARSDAEPSLRREQVADAEKDSSAPSDGRAWCRDGDERLRHGDLMGAVACWEAAIRAGVPDDDAERLREVIALATRLHALVPI
jgi:hypothetical protein